MKIYQKSDALDRFSFFENLSSALSKSPSTGIFFKGNSAYVFDDVACGKLIVRDGRRDSHIFYDFKTGDTLKLDTMMTPTFPQYCNNIFFLNKRKLLAFVKNLNIPKRKAQKALIFIEVRETSIHLTIRSAKGECIGSFSQPLYINKNKVRNVFIKNLTFRTNFYYFYQILLYSFAEYDIIGVRHNNSKEIFMFGKNNKKPNISWSLKGV